MEQTTTTHRSSMFGLLRALSANTRTFVREEAQLAKTELSEKVSRFGRNAVVLGVGGALAGAGGLVLLLGLGWLVGYGLRSAGLNPLLANSIGIIAVGFAILLLGAAVLFKALRTLKSQSLAPERTIKTLQEFKGGPRHESSAAAGNPPKPSSGELQARVEATEERMGQNLDELGRRLSPEHLKAQMKHRIETQPYHSGLIAMGIGILGGLMLRRRKRPQKR